MVDFNNDTTITTPSFEIVKILILQRRYDLMEAIEHYKKQEYTNSIDLYIPLGYVKSRLYTLFLELEPLLKRRLKDTEYREIEEKLASDNFKTIIDNSKTLLEFIDNLKITAIDSRRVIDSSRVEAVNEAKGL